LPTCGIRLHPTDSSIAVTIKGQNRCGAGLAEGVYKLLLLQNPIAILINFRKIHSLGECGRAQQCCRYRKYQDMFRNDRSPVAVYMW
jgi:hypothetical protein